MTEREALKLVYENSTEHDWPEDIWNAIKEVLAKPSVSVEQEPKHVATVAEVHMSRYTIEWTNGPLPEGAKLYDDAPQRKPLTDEEITQVFGVGYVAKEFVEFVRAIEAAHGIYAPSELKE